jgi:predicted ATP-binding protein involved in virulence
MFECVRKSEAYRGYSRHRAGKNHMHISSFQIESYKSFLLTQEIHLTSSFNVIVGKNNAGKTAIIEALSSRFENKPHLNTNLRRNEPPIRSVSLVNIRFILNKKELIEILSDNMRQFYVPASRGAPMDRYFEKFCNAINEDNTIKCIVSSEGVMSSSLVIQLCKT